VAVVGAGYMSREHIRAFRDVPGAEVVGIHSRTRSKAQAVAAEFGVPAVYDSVPEMFERTAADVVVVAVSELQTNEVCRACFEHPWTALIEKPAGFDLADAEAIEAAARSKGRCAYVALNRRHYGSTRAVLADLAAFPGPRLIKVQDQQDPAAALRAGQPKLIVDNWMYANSIHVIDYFSLLGRGQVSKVEPIIPWDPKRPRYVAAKITFDSGDIGLYEAIWDGPGPWAVSVNTPERRWELRPLERGSYQVSGSRVLDPFEAEAWDTQFKPGLRRQAALTVSAALGEPTGLPTVSDALASMRLTHAIYLAD
jgi:predicted dehydrogenase